MRPPGSDDGPFWSVDADVLFASLAATPDGLEEAEAARRLARHGPNRIEDAPALGALRLLARQFDSPLVLILLVGATVSAGLRGAGARLRRDDRGREAALLRSADPARRGLTPRDPPRHRQRARSLTRMSPYQPRLTCLVLSLSLITPTAIRRPGVRPNARS
jgi:hypothetical protein